MEKKRILFIGKGKLSDIIKQLQDEIKKQKLERK